MCRITIDPSAAIWSSMGTAKGLPSRNELYRADTGDVTSSGFQFRLSLTELPGAGGLQFEENQPKTSLSSPW